MRPLRGRDELLPPVHRDDRQAGLQRANGTEGANSAARKLPFVSPCSSQYAASYYANVERPKKEQKEKREIRWSPVKLEAEQDGLRNLWKR